MEKEKLFERLESIDKEIKSTIKEGHSEVNRKKIKSLINEALTISDDFSKTKAYDESNYEEKKIIDEWTLPEEIYIEKYGNS